MKSQSLAFTGESRLFPGLFVVCVAVFTAMAATPAWTQSTATGTVSGQVTDSSAAVIAGVQPGVTPGGSVAGAMYDQNTFQLDGGNNSNDMDGSMLDYTGSFTTNVPTAGSGSPSGTMPTPVESVEEFKVATSGMTADFNGSSGAGDLAWFGD